MKRCLSVLLTTVLLLACIPLGAVSVSAATGGTTGACTWTLDDGHLTISGNGAMANYDWEVGPWGTSIISVSIAEGVTSIGDGAFYGCKSLTSVAIPDSVTSIGDYAFYWCTSLTSVTIPDSVTTIGNYAFYYCTSLTSVTIPDSVTSIGSDAFYRCTSLTSVTIPDSVTSIGSDAFSDCTSLTSVYITDVAAWCGINFSSSSSNPLNYAHNLYLNGELVTELTIPDSVTSIGDRAFSGCASLTSVAIPDSVTSIGYAVFSGCSSLTSVTIPDSVTSIGRSAFSNCTSLTSVTIGDSVTGISDYAFRACSSLTSVTIPDSVTSIGDYAFCDCSSLSSVTIPDSVTSIGESAFSGCDSLTVVTIPDSVTYIGAFAFNALLRCYRYSYAHTWAVTNGRDYVLIDGMDEESIVGDRLGKVFWSLDKRTGILTLTGSGNMVDFSSVDAPWKGYASFILSVEIADSITSVGKNAFYNFDRLTLVTISDSVTRIDSCAFYDCDRLTSVTIPDSVTSIGDYAFYNCDRLVSVIVGVGVTSIGNRAFYGCNKLTSIHIADVAAWCGINFWCMWQDDSIISNPLSYGVDLYLNGTLVTNLIIPDSVTTIGDHAFYNYDKLTSVTIPDSVTSIGDFAFYNCDSLISVNIPDSVTCIGDRAFYECSNVASVVIGNGVTEIGISAFYNCDRLTSVTIGDSVTSIGSSAFKNCSSLISVTIPHKVKYIYSGCFSGCSALSSVTVYSTKCAFDDNCGLNYNHTIYGFVGSTAEAFAEKIGAEFIDVETVHTHSYSDATCTAPKICAVCGKAEGEALGHTYDNDCDTQCNVCDATRTIIHNYIAATCTAPKTCTVCGATEGEVSGHKYNAATCLTPKTCTVCGATEGEVSSHKYTAATCLTPKTCTVCGATEGEANGHKYTNACDTSCNTCGATRRITHAYKTVTKKATTTANGYTVKRCSVCQQETGKTTLYKASEVTLSKTSYTYNGKVQKPTVVVKDSNGKKISSSHYTVKYASGCKNVGIYKVTITFKGNYSGKKVLTYKIIPAKTTVSKLTAGKKSIKIAITKKTTQVSGYQIQYSTDKSFSTYQSEWLTSYKKTTFSATGLKAKKTYYVRVRTYKIANGEEIYSGWSTVKVVKTK